MQKTSGPRGGYVPLANKLRPQFFKDFVYNEPVIAILQSMISNEKLPNGLLFSGQRGLGKTTLARIVARSLNCERRKKSSTEPCGKCDNCRESLAGTHPDIIEIDGATHGNIEDVRKIIDQATYTPMSSRYKIFIIDEVHNLARSQASFDAMLKILEEPPDYVFWIFCTTAKQKIPDVIKSRLVSLDLRMVPTKIIDRYIGDIMMNEWDVGKDGQNEVAPVIALSAKNSIRDALTLLEKIAPYCNEKEWTAATAREAMGSFDLLRVPDILGFIVQKNPVGLWITLSQIMEGGVEPELLFDSLVNIINKIMTLYLGGQIEDPDVYIPFMKYFSQARIIYLCDSVFKRSKDLSISLNKKMVIQVLSMELCA